MSLLIDIIVIAAFSLSFVSGVKKGFVRSIMGIAVVVLALVGSITLSPKVNGYVNDKIIYKPVEKTVESAISGLLSEDVRVDTLLNDQPQAYLSVLDRFGIKPDDVKDALSETDEALEEESKVKIIAKHIAEPVSASLSKPVSFVIVFLALLVSLFIVALILSVIVKLPVLKAADKLLGGILGIVTGTLLAWGLSMAITAIMPHLAVLYEGTVPASVIENSIVVKFLGSFDPFRFIKL